MKIIRVLTHFFSQYGHCQTYKLPCGEFELSQDPETEGREALEKYKLSDDYGYFLEVDLLYPSKLHDQHPHFENPLGEYIKYEYILSKSHNLFAYLYTTAPYMSVIQYDDLSEESKEMLAKTGKKGENYKAKKLLNDFK